MSTELENREIDRLVKELTAVRHRYGVSQQHINDQMDVAERLISKWEAGMKRPTIRSLILWADALNCTIQIIKKEL